MSSENIFTVGIVTVSDTAYGDSAQDKSGPLLQDILTTNTGTTFSYKINKTAIISDDTNQIIDVVRDWTDNCRLDLILLTGGTGFAERDVTPDSVAPLLTRPTPGITHLLISSSLVKTPFAALSRPVSGFRHKTLIITLPGSPKACRENMDALLPILPHALQLVRENIAQVRQTHAQLTMEQQQQHSSTNTIHQQQHSCIHHHKQDQHSSPRTLNLDTPVAKRARVSPYPMIPVQEALRLIHDHAQPVGKISMPLCEDLIGYVLAEDVYAKESVPSYRASIVDGYAVYAEDGTGVYPVSHVSLATSYHQQQDGGDGSLGIHTPFKLQRGQIARVATGGMVPDGANAVVMVEDTKLVEMTLSNQEEAMVEILESTKAGAMIRPIGSDCQQGDLVCKKGTIISTVGGELGVLASVGITSVLVYRKPKIGILSSGNEVQDITMVSRPLAPGEIRDSNRLTLKAAAKQAGFDTVDLGIVPDRIDALERCVQNALAEVDVLITTGGVSMGEADYMKPLLEQKVKATIHFGRVNMKPGKPCTFATAPSTLRISSNEHDWTTKDDKNKLIFALPGNPVSATVTFYLFVLPALRQMSSIQHPENVKVQVKITHDIALDDRPEYHRVLVFCNSENGQLEATSTGKNQQSSRMISMIAANGLLQLPVKSVGVSIMKKGDTVPCIILGPFYQSQGSAT